MKSELCLCTRRGVLLLVLLAVVFVSNLGAKPIRLRNEIIAPDSTGGKGRQLRVAVEDVATSGLYLIQFSRAPSPAWRHQLRALGVDLLRYVPDDAYVARVHNARLGGIRGLPFVTWVGQYAVRDKLDSRLAGARTNAAPEIVEVAVLLSPEATDSDAAQVKRSFQSVSEESRLRLGHIIRGRIASGQLDVLARSDSVLWIEPQAKRRLYDESASKIVAGDGGPNVLLPEALGYNGAGVTVAVADTGLNNGDAATMHPDLQGRTPAFFHYGSLPDASDPHGHGTHVAGIIAGNGATGETDEHGNLYGLGVAPGAQIIAQRIFDANGTFDGPANEKLTRDATRAGAQIGANSWGEDTQGRYTLDAAEFDELVRDADAFTEGYQPYILEFSAGNAGPGPQTIGSPAVAKNVIATGASESDRTNFLNYNGGPETLADFSSRGPCEDGRLKPDLVAPGTWIASLLSASATTDYAWGLISSNYIYMGGSSQSGPQVAGAAAVFVQYYRATHTNATPSPALVKAGLINTAVDLNDANQTGPAPNNDEGWGRVSLSQFFSVGRAFDYVDQTTLLTNGETFQHSILAAGSGQSLKVTLAYTDVPGFPGAIPALVNDLDLEVVAPDGRSYHGNQFNNGESVAGASGWDSVNNVEGVLISQPIPGEYLLRVHARNIVADVYTNTPDFEQDFALVASGNLAPSGNSVVVLDRSAYTAPGVINIKVIDPDASASPTLNVVVTSSTDASGEKATLIPGVSTGSFTGSVTTVTGVAAPDGNLQVTDGDTIQVRYFDISTGSNVFATARADLVPPVLSNVGVTNMFGHTVVKWISDEPSDSVVQFNTNSLLTRTISNTALVTNHSVTLEGLAAGSEYYFTVASTDEAGNAATNDNNGTLFNLTAVPSTTVLLVDAYTDPAYSVPPLSGYTDPLDLLGVSYDVWDTSASGSPMLADLLRYRVVIWRLPEFYGTWSPDEQNTLANYLRDGGSVFVSSMEVLTRLEEGGFGSFAASFLKVQSYLADTTVPQVIGAANDPLGSGINVALDYSPYHDEQKLAYGIPDDVSDTITPAPDAATVFFDGLGRGVGLRYPRAGQDSSGRLIFLSFPIDAVPMTDQSTNNRVEVLGNILRFLAPGFDGRATISLNAAGYTVPSLATVEVDDPNQAGAGSVNVAFTGTTQPVPELLTLPETPRLGTFRGSIELTDPTNAPAAGTLRAQSGDVIEVIYTNSSVGQMLRASAVVDTANPVVSGVTAVPGYIDAAISWNTAAPADSLVQFGESPLSFRTAYASTLTTLHNVTVSGLRPDTLYFYRVVSRDRAGNTTTEDNNGQNYAFTTLPPLLPPWSDNMDGAPGGWSVVSSNNSESYWARGLPDTGSVTNSHSAPNAWGSNLNGDALRDADTSLISPALYLVGGNVATLTFWQNYDFSQSDPIYQYGTVSIITNGVAGPALAPDYHGTSGGWQEVDLDLSPYVGQVINLVWRYQLISISAIPRPGWLVDDVSVTVSNVPPGRIEVTNNLWQTHFNLTGPIHRNGKGTSLVITNAPNGQYSIDFADLPYYVTPPPQMGTLQSGGVLQFQGNYTFADANANGIPDAWELAYFGEVSFNRTSDTDTDGDGMSDAAEFAAGTDPNNPLPPFELLATALSDGSIRLDWPSAPGRSYRVVSSTNLSTWVPMTGWMQANSPSTNFLVSSSSDTVPEFFRVEAGSSTLTPNLQVTTNPLTNGSFQLAWPSTLDHAYRVLGSTDSVSWLPLSDWIQAISPTTSYTLPPPTNGAPNLFRIEAAP